MVACYGQSLLHHLYFHGYASVPRLFHVVSAPNATGKPIPRVTFLCRNAVHGDGATLTDNRIGFTFHSVSPLAYLESPPTAESALLSRSPRPGRQEKQPETCLAQMPQYCPHVQAL